MKKTVLGLFSVSLCALLSSQVIANDKILSPTAGWSAQAGNSQGECLVSNTFEQGVELTFTSVQTQLKSIAFILGDQNFQQGNSYSVSLSVPPSQEIVLDGVAVSSTQITLDVASNPSISQLLQKGFIAYIRVEGAQYGLSLNGMGDALRMLRSCRDSDLRGAQQVYNINDEPSQNAAVQTAAAVASAPVSLKINPFPLDPSKSAAANITQLESTQETATIQASTSSESLEQEPELATTSSIPPAESVIAAANPVNTASSSENIISNEPQKVIPMEALPVPQADAAQGQPVRADLTRPPVLDLPLPPVEDLDEAHNAEIAQIDAGVVQAPDGIIVNEEAQMYVADPSLTKVAEKDDYAEEAAWHSPAPQRPENSQLSQTHEMAAVDPVIIPRVPEADLPTRFDLMNRGKGSGEVSATPQEPPRQVREVSNEELEMQLKAAEQEAALMMEGQNVQDGQTVNEPVVASYPARVRPDVSPAKNEISQADHDTIIQEAPALPGNVPEDAGEAAIFEKPEVTPYANMSGDAKWKAPVGADLRSIIANWAITDNVELIWDSPDQYVVQVEIMSNESFENAIARLLNQYSKINTGNDKPVGELYIDPDTNKKVLIIQSIGS